MCLCLRAVIPLLLRTASSNRGQVAWAPGEKATLVSASDDGAVMVFDFSQLVDEDDSYRAALNLEGAVAR